MQQAQEEIKNLTVIGTAANGNIQIIIDGKYKVIDVKINDNFIHDRKKLEYLILTAVNNANNQISNI